MEETPLCQNRGNLDGTPGHKLDTFLLCNDAQHHHENLLVSDVIDKAVDTSNIANQQRIHRRKHIVE